MNADRRAGRARSAGLALLGLVLVAFVAPALALAGSSQIRLALLPVGQPGSFFDLTMRPGENRGLLVDVANDGDADVAVRTYATDVYTIINGGFGGRLRDTPHTGMTTWVDYATEVVALPAGRAIRRSFAVTVPADAGPGEYITGLVLENDRPVVGSGTVALGQIIRQAVAVVVTVPGARTPGLAIGAATHNVLAGRSVISIAVSNTGNVRLKPVVGFSLLNAAGDPISQTTLQMDTFYAHTDTTVELPLASLLAPGTYTVRLTLEDAAQGARAEDQGVTLDVTAPLESTTTPGVVPGLIDVIAGVGGSQIPIAMVGVLMGAAVLIAVGFAWLIRRRRRHHRAERAEPLARG